MTRLCKTCNAKATWYPASISSLADYLGRHIKSTKGFRKPALLRRNIAYNLQYLHLLKVSLAELRLSSVLATQTCKMFVLVGMSILEAVLHYELRIRELEKRSTWRRCGPPAISQVKLEGKQYRLESQYLDWASPPLSESMDLRWMLQRAEDQKIFGDDKAIYRQLAHLRKQRNKVHLHLVEELDDTDWGSFDGDQVAIMGKLLHQVLTLDAYFPSEEDLARLSFLVEDPFLAA